MPPEKKRPIGLEEMLRAREERRKKQERLTPKEGESLLCLTMNIPGPVKTSRAIRRVFFSGCERILKAAKESGAAVLKSEYHLLCTGPEGYFQINRPALPVKEWMCRIEESRPWGRLLDGDVLNEKLEKLSRTEMGLPRRRCLVCKEEAFFCGRFGRHTKEELEKAVNRLLLSAPAEKIRSARSGEAADEEIGSFARRAVWYELAATPKPGLVDLKNSGAHRDMDQKTFMRSLLAISPYFAQFAKMGREWEGNLGPLLFALRPLGCMCEEAMLKATGGVNTHKGTIFSMGILCAAAGKAAGEKEFSAARICKIASEMCAGLVQREMKERVNESLPTNGRRIFEKYGAGGARAEAESGFASARLIGLPALKEALFSGRSMNDAALYALLALMSRVPDTNLLHRGGKEGLSYVIEGASALLKSRWGEKEGYGPLLKLDGEMTERRLSPGGSADLLSAALFLYFFESGHKNRENFMDGKRFYYTVNRLKAQQKAQERLRGRTFYV